ncbi:MAG: hypothetical protein QOH51_1506 [Acidobacteriota bacterium]|jgi:hypothetical protein|nr:hypothetical protein [Acidobacteriota bacterium]
MKDSAKDKKKSATVIYDRRQNAGVEPLHQPSPAITTLVRITKQLQEEIWIREWETKNTRRSST